jgi:hypothetical protein
MGVSDRLAAFAARVRAGTRRDAVPLPDAEALLPVARRTRALRLGLAAALAACGVAALLNVPSPEGRRFLPSSTVTIVVLDLSSSIRPKSFDLIRYTLEGLIQTNGRFGVVLFSDVAYEALPPGTPANELRPFVRFFERGPLPRGRGGEPLPRTPWEEWFSAGTNISAGLSLAASLLERHHVEDGGVALFSDLADDPSDLQRLAEIVGLYADRKIPLRVVALDPAPENREFFRELLADPGVLSDVRLPEPERARGTLAVEAPFPGALAVLTVVVVVLLTANAWLAEPLRWPRRSG